MNTTKSNVLVLVLIFTFCNPNKGISENEINKEILKNIYNQKLQEAGRIFGISLQFYKDNSFSFEYGSEGKYWYNSGSYTLSDSNLILNSNLCKERENSDIVISCAETFGFGKCKIIDSEQDIFYEKFLLCSSNSNIDAFGLGNQHNEFAFGLPDYATKPGKSARFNNIEVVVLKKKGITTSNVKIRELPNVKSQSIIYYVESYDGPSEKTFVPNRTPLVALAKTNSLDKIQDWSNYWYLVDLGNDNLGWMFGEFIKLDE
ncbi:hypothetical protein ACE5IS_10665 [Leptospira wolffii]